MTISDMQKPDRAAEGRSTRALEIKGTLGATAVEALRRQVVELPAGLTVVPVLCSALTSLDPVGAAALWRLCEECRARGVQVTLVDLPLRFASRLRRHPLLEFILWEEAMFEDPFMGFSPSGR
ncbi:MAG TPA: STAS domain-containing protein [Gemmatimonadales bacterium]|jgi:ABC-type transporter Mla MlaB component|nr:STAS domain-containing protein [Gemmatimonadales bacterium]